MAITFDGQTLFSSGPHTVAFGVRGQEVQALWRYLDTTTAPGNIAIGDEEPEVTVRGRLVAQTEAGLWTLRQAIVAMSAYDADTATLIDNRGRPWEGMRLLTYTEDGPADRGRVWSIGYTAVFARLIGDGP